jgi:filamentous hemagglutinin
MAISRERLADDLAGLVEDVAVIVADASAEAISPAGGGGGHWPLSDERPNAAVRQVDPVSCGAAVGEMLSEGRVKQNEIRQNLTMPTSPEFLAAELRRCRQGDWTGAYVAEPEHALDVLVDRGEPWGAVMFPSEAGGNRLLHMVVVDGRNGSGEIMIRDPWEGSAYRMKSEDFLHFWAGGVVYR